MAMAEKYGAGNISNQKFTNDKGSSLNMMRNDSDMSLSKIDPTKKMKYDSLDRGSGGVGEELSPPERRKKANVHL